MNMAQKIQPRLLEYGSYMMVLLVVAIYLSTSLAVILSSLLCIMWLFSAQYKDLSSIFLKNPVVAWSFLLLLWFFVGLSYTNVSYEIAISMIMKDRELFFIPVFIAFLRTARLRSQVWQAFIIASIAILLISYLMSLGVLELNKDHSPSLKSHITHSIFIAFFGFYCAHQAYNRHRYAKGYWLLFLLSVYNLFFVVDGRTGQLIAVSLALLFGIQRFTKKVLLIGVLVLAFLFALFLSFSEKATRINEGLASTQAYIQAHPEKAEFSMGERFTFWKYSAKLIAEKPLIGHGTGSYATEYTRIASSEHLSSNNPHNEFLLITVQLGLLGLVIYLGFLSSQYYLSKKLPNPEKWLAQGVLLCLLVTSLFNSPLMDHAEGHWFALMIALCFAPLHDDTRHA